MIVHERCRFPTVGEGERGCQWPIEEVVRRGDGGDGWEDWERVRCRGFTLGLGGMQTMDLAPASKALHREAPREGTCSLRSSARMGSSPRVQWRRAGRGGKVDDGYQTLPSAFDSRTLPIVSHLGLVQRARLSHLTLLPSALSQPMTTSSTAFQPTARFERALALFAAAHASDPAGQSATYHSSLDGYVRQLSSTSANRTLKEGPSEALLLAANCQHVRRWERPRR